MPRKSSASVAPDRSNCQRDGPGSTGVTGGSGTRAAQVRLDVGHRVRAVRRAEPVEEAGLAELVLLGADGLDDVGGQQAAHLGGADVVEPPRERRQEAGPERVTDPGRVGLALLGRALDLDRGFALAVDPDALRSERRDPGADPLEDLLRAPPGLLLGERGLVLVGEEVGRAVDQLPDARAVHPRDLLTGVDEERVAALPALLRVAQHRL